MTNPKSESIKQLLLNLGFTNKHIYYDEIFDDLNNLSEGTLDILRQVTDE